MERTKYLSNYTNSITAESEKQIDKPTPNRKFLPKVGKMDQNLENKTTQLLGLCQDQELLYSLSRDKLKKIMKEVRTIKERKYKRNHVPKYRVPGYKAMSLEEVDRFFSAFHPDEWRSKVMFQTQAFLGLRIGETVKIRIEDIDFQNKQIKIRTEKQGPYEIMDSMFLHERLETLLQDYIHEYEREIIQHKGYLFFSETFRGKYDYITADRARNIFREICNRANLTEYYGNRTPISGVKNFKPGKLYKLTTHSLRYAFAQYLRRQEIPIEIRQHLMRHKSRETMQIYDAPQKPEVDGYLRQAFSNAKLMG